MKIRKYIGYKTLPLAFLALGLSSCGDFLKESSQDTDYVRTWNDLDELLLGSAYMPVNESSNFLSQNNYGDFLHLLTDELEEQTSGQDYNDGHDQIFGYFTWQQRTGQNPDYTDFYPENTTWTKVYYAINVCNNILESIKDVPQTLDAEKQGALKVAGEAHFLRGYYYFWLTNLYGKAFNPETASTDLAVPIKITSEVQDTKFRRNTVAECYEVALADLLEAEKELSQYKTAQKSIYRADSTAVQLLLSRVFLYVQNWEKAAEYAQKVIKSHPQLQDLNSNKASFMQLSNPETLFSMGGDDLPCMLNYGAQSLKVSDQQYQAYSGNDLRRSLWFWRNNNFTGITKQPEGTAYTNLKKDDSRYYYQAYTDGYRNMKTDISSIFWLHASEAYLNLAEAEAYMGNENLARNAINTLRENRLDKSSKGVMIESSGDKLIQDIREERRRELVLEGHRWFDLRRYRVCKVAPDKTAITHDYAYYPNNTSKTINTIHRFVLTEDDKSWVLPIPHEVLEFNDGMQNNENEYRNYTVVK